MKRSEMVSIIKNSLPWMNTLFATKVLEVIEKAGMLPPPKEHEFESFKRAKEGHGFAMVSINRFKWEPEDEN